MVDRDDRGNYQEDTEERSEEERGIIERAGRTVTVPLFGTILAGILPFHRWDGG